MLIAGGHAQTPAPHAASELDGTSWQLVNFRGGDGTTLAPDEPAKYTVEFDGNGSVRVRIDCNRGGGAWQSTEAGQVEFGPLALTRAMCPPSALNDRLAGDWREVRSYTLKDGRLLLALTAGGGTYEFEPLSRGAAENLAETAATGAGAIPGLPATFMGTLPCADCPGITYHVDLFPDHTFSSRMTYEGRNARFDQRGRWQLADGGRTLVLESGRGEPARFSVQDADTLRKLDGAGQKIASRLNYDLKRAPSFTAIESPGRETASSSLENTEWRLTLLPGVPISAASAKQPPHLVLASEAHRVSGAGGCNQLTGSYRLDGDRISFTRIAATMMACAQGMDAERSFLAALKDVRAWKITGRELELLDASGKLLARFESGSSR